VGDVGEGRGSGDNSAGKPMSTVRKEIRKEEK
jgi:hypothetical protein